MCAAVLAGAVAFTVSVYPNPGASQLLQLSPPLSELSEHPQLLEDSLDRLFEPASLKRVMANLSAIDMPDMLQLVGLLTDQFRHLPPGTLMELVGTSRLPDVVNTLERIAHFESTAHYNSVSFGGASGGGSSGAVPVNLVPTMVMLLEYLMNNLPGASAQVLRDVFATVLPTLTRALGITHLPPLTVTQVNGFLEQAITLASPAAIPALQPQPMAPVHVPASTIAHTPAPPPPVAEVQVHAVVESPTTAYVAPPAPPTVEPPVPSIVVMSATPTPEPPQTTQNEAPPYTPVSQTQDPNPPDPEPDSISDSTGGNSPGTDGDDDTSGNSGNNYSTAGPGDSPSDNSDSGDSGGGSPDNGSSGGDAGGDSAGGE
ncbi:MAG: hypothetical protein WBB00_04590 [Mycobacterium sp.]